MRVRNRPSRPHRGPERQPASGPNKLAALARLTLVQAHPPLTLPTLSGLATTYRARRGDDEALTLAATAVKAGLGSIRLWEKANGSPTLFLRDALNEWLRAQGAAEVAKVAEFTLAITTHPDNCNLPDGQALALIEAGASGCLSLGAGLARMEEAHPGLGRDFFLTLLPAMNRWIPTYDSRDAERLIERWRENAEYDREPRDARTFEEYCRQEGLHFPDIEADMPVFLRNLDWRRAKEAADRLEARGSGEFRDLIDAVLELRKLRPASHVLDPLLEDAWEDGPLPGWVVRFAPDDAIEQSFDEECQTYLETSHEPLWAAIFPVDDTKAFRQVLKNVEHFLKANLLLTHIQKRFSEMEEKSDASCNQRRKRA